MHVESLDGNAFHIVFVMPKLHVIFESEHLEKRMEAGDHCSDAEKNGVSLKPDPFVFVVVSICLEAPLLTLGQRCPEMVLVLQIVEVEVVEVELDIAVEIELLCFPFLGTLFPFLHNPISDFLNSLDRLLIQQYQVPLKVPEITQV